MILVFSISIRLEDAYLYMDKSQSLLPEGSTNKLMSATVQGDSSLLPSSSRHVWGRVLALGCCKIKVHVILRVVIALYTLCY